MKNSLTLFYFGTTLQFIIDNVKYMVFYFYIIQFYTEYKMK